MEPTSTLSPAAPKFDPRSAAAAALCVGAAFFDALGWLAAIVGIILLRRASFTPRTKWLLAAVAVVPKVLFLGVRVLTAPRALSFTFEPWTLATSSSVWAWSTILAAFGVWVVLQSRRTPLGPGGFPQPDAPRPLVLTLVGFIPIAVAAVVLLGLFDGFHRIEDAGDGRWALKHAAFGRRAVFARNEVAHIEGTENRSRRGSSDSVRLTLTDGRSYSVTTGSPGAFDALRRFAVTADLPPGTARIVRRGATWTNAGPGFNLGDYVGRYEWRDEANHERRTLEFWRERDRLAGKETISQGGSTHVRALRDIVLSDTGDMEFQPATIAGVSESSPGTLHFSLQWSPSGETARLTKNGIEMGARTFRRR